jgi:YVTN family beta-propeller protein
MASNETDDLMYVTNFNSNNLSVIDVGTNTVICTIEVGYGPSDITYVPSLNRVYVLNFTSGDISVIDASTNQIICTISASGLYMYGIDYLCDSSSV